MTAAGWWHSMTLINRCKLLNPFQGKTLSFRNHPANVFMRGVILSISSACVDVKSPGLLEPVSRHYIKASQSSSSSCWETLSAYSPLLSRSSEPTPWHNNRALSAAATIKEEIERTKAEMQLTPADRGIADDQVTSGLFLVTEKGAKVIELLIFNII